MKKATPMGGLFIAANPAGNHFHPRSSSMVPVATE